MAKFGVEINKKRRSSTNENELPSKKSTLEILTLDIDLLSINEDCLFAIFEFIPLDDLCVVTKVCTQLKASAENYFKHKYPSKKIYVTVNSNTTIVFPKEEYTDIFQKCTDNVSFAISGTFLSQYECFQLQCKTNSEFDVKHVQFKSMDLDFYEGPMDDDHKELVEKLETIVFWDCSFSHQLKELLRHCNQLKCLIIYCSDREKNGKAKRNYDHFIKKFKMLERFQCDFNDGIFTTDNKWQRFLQLNS